VKASAQESSADIKATDRGDARMNQIETYIAATFGKSCAEDAWEDACASPRIWRTGCQLHCARPRSPSAFTATIDKVNDRQARRSTWYHLLVRMRQVVLDFTAPEGKSFVQQRQRWKEQNWR